MNTEPRAVIFPGTKIDDTDFFGQELAAVMEDASPEDMRRAAVRAAQYIEEVAESAGLEMNYVNNATATLCTIVRELAIEVENLRTELGKGEEK